MLQILCKCLRTTLDSRLPSSVNEQYHLEKKISKKITGIGPTLTFLNKISQWLSKERKASERPVRQGFLIVSNLENIYARYSLGFV